MDTQTQRRARAALIFSMVIFGTIGIFRRHINLPSGVIAMLRGAVGMAFLLLTGAVRGQKINLAAVRRNFPVLALSGTVMGFNWILLFEAYRYTSVAVATLCYYMAPIFVILASPVLLSERITRRRLLCVSAALAGMVLVSGILQAGVGGGQEFFGIALGLGAAALYAAVILLNKRMEGLSSADRTIVQLGVAAAVLLPYTLLTGELTLAAFAAMTPLAAVMLMVVCVVHTGLSYALYFGSMNALPAQTVALLSYIDPVVAILLSALLLGETLSVPAAIGAALVLGAAVVSEMPSRKGGVSQ